MNQYRCETCKNVGCHIHPENKSSINYDTGVRYDHFSWYDSFMRKMGCASHSDFQNQREKVLDILKAELLDWLNRISKYGTDSERCIILSLLSSIRELRGEQ
jgi:hypothetical protein